MEEKRLSKALADAGIAARRKAEEMIFDGRVKVNGKIVLTPQTKVVVGKDKILVDEEFRVRPVVKKTFILNKPKGYICSNTAEDQERLVIDLFYREKTRLFTVGRLDKDTTGLLLVTNDGELANQIIHPSSDIVKEYHLRVADEITPEHIQKLQKGAFIDKRRVKPTYVKKIKSNHLIVGIKEGKKHEVKILALRARLRLRDLKRTKIGSLCLDKLPLGAYRALTKKDKEKLFSLSK
ncbi:MAG: pseudouridine synthase [Chlamydiota bacterium]|jgi:23S rRNA pseudouridine2605 synthase